MRSRALALGVLCLCSFTINIDTSIVNVALPSLVTELGASTRELQWIVDAYNLAFAALVLAAGSLSDRFGRQRALLLGLAVFGIATLVGSTLTSPESLTVARAVMGVGAALIFPSTLSIIANLFPVRAERAKAIGLWGATTGLGVALGPITGGWLLGHFWWGSVFVVMAPVTLVAFVACLLFVPNSRDPQTPPIDIVGLALSTVGIGTLIFTIIEAPEKGWTEPATIGGFAASLALVVVFWRWEHGREHPMLDVGLFRNLRFSAASGAVTVAFFALFGFIFLVTQYFQFVRGYSALSAGVRVIPLAVCLGIASVTGVKLAVRLGNKVVIAGGLAVLGVAFLWISAQSASTPYLVIMLQMMLLGAGMGFTSAPATEAIMGVVPKDKAGVGSAVNDATRQLGGTLGVAVIGSVYASVYASKLSDATVTGFLPADAASAATDSIGAAFAVADRAAVVAGPRQPQPCAMRPQLPSSTAWRWGAWWVRRWPSPGRSSSHGSCRPGRWPTP